MSKTTITSPELAPPAGPGWPRCRLAPALRSTSSSRLEAKQDLSQQVNRK